MLSICSFVQLYAGAKMTWLPFVPSRLAHPTIPITMRPLDNARAWTSMANGCLSLMCAALGPSKSNSTAQNPPPPRRSKVNGAARALGPCNFSWSSFSVSKCHWLMKKSVDTNEDRHPGSGNFAANFHLWSLFGQPMLQHRLMDGPGNYQSLVTSGLVKSTW